jgi:hypothetical protein
MVTTRATRQWSLCYHLSTLNTTTTVTRSVSRLLLLSLCCVLIGHNMESVDTDNDLILQQVYDPSDPPMAPPPQDPADAVKQLATALAAYIDDRIMQQQQQQQQQPQPQPVLAPVSRHDFPLHDSSACTDARLLTALEQLDHFASLFEDDMQLCMNHAAFLNTSLITQLMSLLPNAYPTSVTTIDSNCRGGAPSSITQQ